jgi:steroid delta-isomerase-like uncharacterized protein
MSLYIDENRIEARLNQIQEHIRCENQHDLTGIMQTFGATAEYNDLPWVDMHTGRDGVESYYAQILKSVPDLFIDVQRRHVAGDTVVLEVIIRGTHLGEWRGLPPTGRTLAIPLCAIFTFDNDDRLAGEKIYYDRATVLRQLGVFHEPQTPLGKVMTALTHPVTMARALITGLSRR